MKIIIAEKPSLAKTIVNSISSTEHFDKKNGYFEGKNFIVTFAFGHLFELYGIKDYTGEKDNKKIWQLGNLPFHPDKFKFKLKDDAGVQDQYKVIKKLIARNDIDGVVNCGDSDREGQVIGDLIINHSLRELQKNIPVYRLWLPEQTEDTISAAVNDLQPNSNYKNLYSEGVARMFMDWLLGINLTIFTSVKLQKLMRVGRVVIPIVKIVYDRDMAIKNFKPEKYYQAESNEITNDEKINLSFGDKFSNINDCKTIIEQLNSQKAIVTKLETKDVKKRPSKLFSLSTLQNVLSKQYKMTLPDSLKIIQGLYEKGYITYPRTNSEYLAEAEKSKVKKIIDMLHGDTEKFLEVKDSKKIFDDSKIESHSALIITNKKLNGSFSDKEKIVYNTIKNRFISNFFIKDCIISRTNLDITIGDNVFTLKGDTVKEKGFLEYEPMQKKDSILPNVKINDQININFKAVEKETTPPAKYDISMLNNYLKNPFKSELKNTDSEDDTEEYKAMLNGVEIGTEATRTGIIEKAKFNEYISEENTKLSIMPLGIKLIETLDKMHINLYKDKTVEFSQKLKNVYKKTSSVQSCIEYTTNELNDIITAGINIAVEPIKSDHNNKEREIIGKCPRCGKNIYENDKAFGCEGYKDDPPCKFALWKENYFFTPRGKKITKTIAKSLLKDKKAIVKGFTKKDGSSTYDGIVSMKDTGSQIEFSFSFANKKGKIRKGKSNEYTRKTKTAN